MERIKISSNIFPGVVGDVYYDPNNEALFVNTGNGWTMMTAEQMADRWSLFLDDERSPSFVGISPEQCVIARSTAEAQALIGSNGLPFCMWLDHDLGGEDTSFKFMWWLINGHLDKKWDLNKVERVFIHSRNPIGARKLVSLWQNFCSKFGIKSTISEIGQENNDDDVRSR